MRGRTEARQRQSRARALHVECSWTTASLLTALPIWAGAWEEDMRRAVAASVSRGNPVQDLLDRAKLLFVAAIIARSLPAPASAWGLVHPWSCIALDHGPRNQSGAFEAWPASHVAALMLAAAVALLGSRGHSILHGFNHRAGMVP